MSMWLFQSTLSANMFRLVDADEDTDVQKFMVLLRNIDAMTVVCLHTQDLQVKHCWNLSSSYSPTHPPPPPLPASLPLPPPP